MDKVDMIKEEIRRWINEADAYRDDYLERFRNASKDSDKDFFIRMADLYANEYMSYRRVLDYIEKEVQ